LNHEPIQDIRTCTLTGRHAHDEDYGFAFHPDSLDSKVDRAVAYHRDELGYEVIDVKFSTVMVDDDLRYSAMLVMRFVGRDELEARNARLLEDATKWRR